MKAPASVRAWSLCQELSTLELAAQGCAELLWQLAQIHGDERAARELASQGEAAIILLHLRLRDLGRVLRGELDPALLAAPHNLMPSPETRTNPGEDVLFSSELGPRVTGSTRRSSP